MKAKHESEASESCTFDGKQGKAVKRFTHDEGRLAHLGVNGSPVEGLELVPLSSDDNGGGSLTGLKSRVGDGDLLLVCWRERGRKGERK